MSSWFHTTKVQEKKVNRTNRLQKRLQRRLRNDHYEIVCSEHGKFKPHSILSWLNEYKYSYQIVKQRGVVTNGIFQYAEDILYIYIKDTKQITHFKLTWL